MEVMTLSNVLKDKKDRIHSPSSLAKVLYKLSEVSVERVEKTTKENLLIKATTI